MKHIIVYAVAVFVSRIMALFLAGYALAYGIQFLLQHPNAPLDANVLWPFVVFVANVYYLCGDKK